MPEKYEPTTPPVEEEEEVEYTELDITVGPRPTVIPDEPEVESEIEEGEFEDEGPVEAEPSEDPDEDPRD